MSAKEVIFITGANTGLGLEIVKSLCRSEKSYHIVIGCRTTSKGEAAVQEVKQEYPSTSSTFEVLQADLSSDSSLRTAIDTITSEHGKLDVLLNNGGASFDQQISSGAMSIREGWMASWDTNVAGTQVLTTWAVPLLLKSSNPRILFITSGTSTLTETEMTNTESLKRLNASPEAGWPKDGKKLEVTAYRSTKTGLNMMMREWTRILGNDGVKVWAISPGMLATGLGGVGPEFLRKIGAIEPSVGADFTVSVIEGARDQDVGKVIRKDMVQPW